MTLDQSLTDVRIPFGTASAFFAGLKTAAQEAAQEVAAEPPVPAADDVVGEGPATSQAPAVEAAGPFAAPTEDVVAFMAQLAGHNLKQQLAYVYYAEMVRGGEHEGVAEIFEERAEDELNEAKYLLKRISALVPGGVALPPSPTPTPAATLDEALVPLIVGEQQALALLKTLHSMCGEDPMKYTIEATMGTAQGHLDTLLQLQPAGKTAAKEPKGAIPIPDPEHDTTDAYLQREEELNAAQLAAENAELFARAEELQRMLETHQAEVASTQIENENLQAQMQVVQQQADQMAMSAQQATEMATQQSQAVGAEADAKMRLGMRLQQIRQQLSEIVASDPVAEEGADVPALQTQTQDQAMAEEAALAEETGGAPKPAKEQSPAAKVAAAVARRFHR